MEYFVKRVDVLEWTGINRAELVHTGWLEPEPIRAWAQLCHDGENLYVRMEAEETPVRATLTGVLDQVCDDSCLEFSHRTVGIAVTSILSLTRWGR